MYYTQVRLFTIILFITFITCYDMYQLRYVTINC